MKHNSASRKVKPTNNDILPFPAESLERLRAQIAGEIISALLTNFGLNAGQTPANSAAPAPLSVVSEEGKLDTEARRARLEVLFEHLLSIPELKGAVRPPSGKNMPRIYFDEDHSFLYFDRWGSLHAGIKGGDRVNCEAARVIKQYQLKRVL